MILFFLTVFVFFLYYSYLLYGAHIAFTITKTLNNLNCKSTINNSWKSNSFPSHSHKYQTTVQQAGEAVNTREGSFVLNLGLEKH